MIIAVIFGSWTPCTDARRPPEKTSAPLPLRSPAMTDALRRAFKVYDANGDGTLTSDELKAILSRPIGNAPPQFTEAQVDELVKFFDVNGD